MRGQEEAERGEVAEEEDEVTGAVAPKIPPVAPEEEGSPLFKVKVLDTLFVRREVLFWMLLEGKGAEGGERRESDGLELLC